MGAATSLLALTLQTTTLHSWPTFDPWWPPFKNFFPVRNFFLGGNVFIDNHNHCQHHVLALHLSISVLPAWSRAEILFWTANYWPGWDTTNFAINDSPGAWANSLLSGLNLPWNQLLKLYCTQISQKWSSIHHYMVDLNLLNKDC